VGEVGRRLAVQRAEPADLLRPAPVAALEQTLEIRPALGPLPHETL
jgi:hypothetical protein